MKTVYLETSFMCYLVSVPSRDLVIAAHQHISHNWWMFKRYHYTCYASEIVTQEAEAGDLIESKKRMEILDDMPLLDITDDVTELARKIINSKILPDKAIRDAAHIAVATVHEMDFLLTWNCKHLANAHIFKQIERVCQKSGYCMPVICTPEELME